MKIHVLRAAAVIALLILGGGHPWAFAGQAAATRTLSGVVVNGRNETIADVTLTVVSSRGEVSTESGADGTFQIEIPDEPVVVRLGGRFVVPREMAIAPGGGTRDLTIRVEMTIPRIHEQVVIVASPLDPVLDRRNQDAFSKTLFSRDDQVFHLLDAGISAGQHEGGGKSLEIRRFGFNLDHGGVNGGLKVMIDNIQQNHSTQGHGQGYLGQLKSLSPELVQEAIILNGPFSAEYGDFSGLGVVHLRLRESLPETLLVRIQGGSFDTFRGFVGFSPELRSAHGLVAYEASRSDGPFINPLRYKRDNITGNYTRTMGEGDAFGFRFNAGRNDFTSSGQIPLDEVEAGRLDRFGFVDPHNGGRVRSGVLSGYYRNESADGRILKLDGFMSRSLFDLFSNFTFFLEDEENGDEIQQHDSRLQEGANAQYLLPFAAGGSRALLTLGANFHASQINVGLYNTVSRDPIDTATKANVRVVNGAGYIQQGLHAYGGRLHVEGGLRYDYFRFDVRDRIEPAFSGIESASRIQPKANLAITPSLRVPITLHANYGRGISSQDARGVVQRPDGVKVSTTDFYQLGAAHAGRRLSLLGTFFLINRSNEQVYIPDDGSFEFLGPTRAYGFEAKTSIRIASALSFNGGLTKVVDAYYRDTAPRIHVDSAPHYVSNAALTLSDWRGFTGSLRLRHITGYRLDGEDPNLRASGYTVVDLGVSRRLVRGLDLNIAFDNLTDKRYYETQNFFESRLRPGDPVIERIHATPGYPFGVTVGITLSLFPKH